MKGSFPFWVSMWYCFGRARRSDTLPCDRPRMFSPNRRWLMEYCERASLIYVRIGITLK